MTSRYIIRMDHEIIEEIRALGCGSVAETIRKALKLYKYLVEADRKGFDVVIEKWVDKEITCRYKLMLP